MRTCSNCGHETKSNEKFCINCGTLLPELSEISQNNTTGQQELVPPSTQTESVEEPIHLNNSFNQPGTIPFQQGETAQHKQICVNCGRVSSKPSKFCLECGAPLPEIPHNNVVNPTIANQQQTRSQNVQPPKEKKPISRGKKIGIISVIVLFILIIGAHLYIQNMFDPKGQLEKITKHFEDKNEEEFMNSFNFPEKTYVNADSFYEYIDDNEWILDDLKDAVKEVKKDGKASIENEDGTEIITLSSEPFLFLYKKVTFEVEPVEVIAYNNFPEKDIELKIDGHDSIKLSDDKVKVGLFAPGNYEYTLTFKDDYFENKITDEIYLEGNEYEFTFDISENAVYLSSDIDDAIVFINGENTGKTASEIELIAAPLDGSVEIYAEATNDNGETIQSETLYLTEYDTHLYFAEIQEQNQIQDFYDYYSYDAEDLFYNFRSDYQYAVNTADFSYVEDYFNDGSKLKKDYEKFVVDHEKFDYYYYDFISNEVMDIQPLSANSLILDSFEIFEYTSDEDGTWQYEREKRYTIEYIDGMLQITNIEDLKEVNKTRVE